jgi:hypothetical protein
MFFLRISHLVLPIITHSQKTTKSTGLYCQKYEKKELRVHTISREKIEKEMKIYSVYFSFGSLIKCGL